MSFLLDPPLLVASGAAAEQLAGDDPARQSRLRAVTVASYVGISLGLYANIEPLARVWPTFGARSGREFMLTSGLASVDEQAITKRQHAAALSLFLLYPLWYELGRRLARPRT